MGDHSHSAEEIKKLVRGYKVVFMALAALTVVTVAISYLHLPLPLAITAALIVATIKGSLVAAFFMHLASERKIIYAILLLTLVFFIVLLIYPAIS